MMLQEDVVAGPKKDSPPPKKEKVQRPLTLLGFFYGTMHRLFILLLIALIIFGAEHKSILQALHDYQQPTVQVK